MKRSKAAPDSPSGSCSERPVKLNVGGQLFWTTTTTLSSTTGHVLARIFAADGSEGVHGTALLDDDGVPFIDRDPTHFRLILNFLRDGFTPLPPTLHERQQLRQEALFYGLQPLAEAIERADQQFIQPQQWDGLQQPSADLRQQSQLETLSNAANDVSEELEALTEAADKKVQALQGATASICAAMADFPEQDLAGVTDELARIARRLTALRQSVEGNAGEDSDGM